MPLCSVINTCTVHCIFASMCVSLIMWKGVGPELTALSPTRLELIKFCCSWFSYENEYSSVSGEVATLRATLQMRWELYILFGQHCIILYHMNSARIKQQQKCCNWMRKVYIWIISSGLYLNWCYNRRKICTVRSLMLLMLWVFLFSAGLLSCAYKEFRFC